MSESKVLRSIAKSKSSAVRYAKTLSGDEVESAIKNLRLAAVEIKKKEAVKAEKIRKDKLTKLAAIIRKMDLSPTDLRQLGKETGIGRKAKPRRRKKVEPKYKVRLGKETLYWSGRGKMPLVFKELYEKHGSLDNWRIR